MADAPAPSPDPAPEPESAAPPEKELGRIAARKAQAQRLMKSALDMLEAKRQTSTPVAIAYDTYGRDTEAGGAVMAAALAFRIFLFYVPYAFFMVFTFGIGADAAHTSPSTAARRAGMGGLLAKAVSTAENESTRTRLIVIGLSGYALFFGARGVIKVLRIVHGLVWQVPIPRLRHATRAALMLVLVVTAAMALSIAISALRNRFLFGLAVTLALYTLVPFAMWLYVSWLLPHPPVDVWALVPGAALFAIGFEALHVFTLLYFPHLISSKSSTYGVIGIALVVLFWAYLIGRLVTLAAVFNAVLYFRRAPQAGQEVGLGGPEVWRSVMRRAGGLFGFRSSPKAEPGDAGDRPPD